MRKTEIQLLIIFLGCLLFAGCMGGDGLGKGEYEYEVMFMRKTQMELTGISYHTDTEELDELVRELWGIFTMTPQDVDAVSIVSENIVLEDWNLEEDVLNLFFSEGYSQMDFATELLLRAGVVETYLQIPGVEGIRFYVGGQLLTDGRGNPIPVMTEADFVDITGEEVNAVQISNLSLYYANQKGDALVTDTMKVAYSSSSSIEEFIVDQLIQGPDREGLYPTLDEKIELNSMDVRENVCYLDFNESFLNNTLPVQAEVIIFSIVNSLCELPDIYQVQFSVNGATNVKFRDSIPLNEAFERNLDYVESEQKVQIVEKKS